jgi:predicted acetyltransferase
MNFTLKPTLRLATIEDSLIIQNLGRFYVYELSRECGTHYAGFESPENGLFEFAEASELQDYFIAQDKHAFIITIGEELAGFALISKLEIMPEIDFYLTDFFVLAKFQHQKVGTKIAFDLFNRFEGTCALGVIPENTKALGFWRKTISTYTGGHFTELMRTSAELKTAEHPNPFPMIIFKFQTRD